METSGLAWPTTSASDGTISASDGEVALRIGPQLRGVPRAGMSQKMERLNVVELRNSLSDNLNRVE